MSLFRSIAQKLSYNPADTGEHIQAPTAQKGDNVAGRVRIGPQNIGACLFAPLSVNM